MPVLDAVFVPVLERAGLLAADFVAADFAVPDFDALDFAAADFGADAAPVFEAADA